jgi:pSer/pThr/pTyr-binding forkhead associated (FHA) protein
MRDGRTRRIEQAPSTGDSFGEFRRSWQASLYIVSGGPEGTEYLLDRSDTTMGRGPGVDLAFDDPTMSREHAAVEFADGGFRLRDLGSTNGVRLNESEVKVAELKNGDRLQVGQLVLQFVLEKRERPAKTYVLPEA